MKISTLSLAFCVLLFVILLTACTNLKKIEKESQPYLQKTLETNSSQKNLTNNFCVTFKHSRINLGQFPPPEPLRTIVKFCIKENDTVRWALESPLGIGIKDYCLNKKSIQCNTAAGISPWCSTTTAPGICDFNDLVVFKAELSGSWGADNLYDNPFFQKTTQKIIANLTTDCYQLNKALLDQQFPDTINYHPSFYEICYHHEQKIIFFYNYLTTDNVTSEIIEVTSPASDYLFELPTVVTN